MNFPQWVKDAWANISTVTASAWGAMPQGARDFLKGLAFGVVLTALAFSLG